MEITGLETIPVAHSLPEGQALGDARGRGRHRETTLVRLETDAGLVGWGEAFAPGRIASATVEEFFRERVLGMDPYDVESLAEETYTDPYHFGGDVFVQSALSGIDVACWDLIGKETGRPVHRLIGGEGRDELLPYASTMYFTEADVTIEEQIQDAVDDGFTAAKLKIGSGVEEDVRRVRVAREYLGEDGILMVDTNGNYRPHQAIESARAIAEYDVAWIEEPVPPENESGYERVAAKVDTAIAAGEAHFGRFAFKRLIDSGAVDVVQPNLGRCGGFSEARLIADVATTENVAVRPHVWNSAVGMAAAVQFAASMPDYPHTWAVPEPMLLECDRSENPLRTDLLETPLDPTGGSLDVPQGPGLGVTVDEAAVERYRADR